MLPSMPPIHCAELPITPRTCNQHSARRSPRTLRRFHHQLALTITLATALLTHSAAETAANDDAPSAAYTILPERITLNGSGASQKLLLMATEPSGVTRDLTEEVRFRAVPDNIVRLSDSEIIAVGNGSATITASLRGAVIANLTVQVEEADSQPRPAFRRDVLPILTRMGCNSGACHGALAGKGGFRLSLRGYDPEKDHFNIAFQQRARRLDPMNPGLSLLLTKPTTAVPHKGGLRLRPDSREYQTLSQWIAQGAPGPQSDAPVIEELVVTPPFGSPRRGETQQLLVTARYTDGTSADVTHLAKFSSANEAVITVTEDGRAQVVGPGIGAVTAWYDSRVEVARFAVPWENEIPESVFADSPRRNMIDDLVLNQLQQLKLPPSPRCSDDVFIRRLFLDAMGILPTAEEVRLFTSDNHPDKRDQLIERVLAREEFVDYWTYRWSDLLLINGTLLRPDAVKAYYQWIREHVEANTPWDQLVRELLTAKGSGLENGAANFFALHQSPEDMAENTSKAFLGLSIGCAKCHNHPLEKWTNDQYYAFASLFSRVRAKGWGGDSRNGDGKRIILAAATGELIQPRTGRPQTPAPLDAAPINPADPTDRRIRLAEWLTAPENSLFSRSVTNRVWKACTGIGLVEQVDDMRQSNPASNEALLQALADHLVSSGFDIRSLLTTIFRSETYQRSSLPVEGNAEDRGYYARYIPRRMMAEVALDAISQVTEVPGRFTEIAFPGNDIRGTNFYPEGTRAVQLYDSAVRSRFLQKFGRNPRQITCECERSDEPSLVQILHLANGDTVNEKLTTKENRLGRLLDAELSHKERIEELYLTTLSRPPSQNERSGMLATIRDTSPEDLRLVYEDILWSLISSREFLFHH